MENFKNMSLSLEERRLAFLEDMVNYYIEDTRCMNSEGGCFYYPGHIKRKTEGCAIGRHLMFDKHSNPMAIDGDLEYKNGIENAINISWFNKLMPEWLKALNGDEPYSFLASCQDLHDADRNWNEEGLTYFGLSHLQAIKERYNLI